MSKEEYFSALPLSLVLGWQSLGGRHSSRALPARPQPAMVGTLEVDDDYVVTCRAAQRAVRYLLLSGAARARASAVHARTCAYRRQRGRQKGGGSGTGWPSAGQSLGRGRGVSGGAVGGARTVGVARAARRAGRRLRLVCSVVAFAGTLTHTPPACAACPMRLARVRSMCAASTVHPTWRQIMLRLRWRCRLSRCVAPWAGKLSCVPWRPVLPRLSNQPESSLRALAGAGGRCSDCAPPTLR